MIITDKLSLIKPLTMDTPLRGQPPYIQHTACLLQLTLYISTSDEGTTSKQ